MDPSPVHVHGLILPTLARRNVYTPFGHGLCMVSMAVTSAIV